MRYLKIYFPFIFATVGTPVYAQAAVGFVGSGILQIVSGLILLFALVFFGMRYGFDLTTKHKNQYGVDEYENGSEYAGHQIRKAMFTLVITLIFIVAFGLIAWGILI